MSLDAFQQVFTLSLASNLVSGCTGKQEDLQKGLQNLLPSVFPSDGWQLAWGPVVWKHNNPDDPSTGPDNSWYVAFHPNFKFEDGSLHPTYVIAIAGTPPNASYVWETQNFAVDTVSDFQAWVDSEGGIGSRPIVAKEIKPGVPYIATGTVNTVHFLLTTPTPAGAASPQTTLLEFITNLDKPGSLRFITAGHSLGGALSPSLALALVAAKVIPTGRTLTYPSAGASPGNEEFADLFIQEFPARKAQGAKSYQGWNLNLVNTLDIVPRAWGNIDSIPPIYGNPDIFLVQIVVALMIGHAAESGVSYKSLPSQDFTGITPHKIPEDVEEFIAIALPQHMEAYFDEAGIDLPWHCQMPTPGVHQKSGIEKRFDYPVIAGLEWAHEHPKEAEKEYERVEAPKGA